MIHSTLIAGTHPLGPAAAAKRASGNDPARKVVDTSSFTALPGLQDVLLAIDTPVVDSEGCPVFEVGNAEKVLPSASETLKPVVSAILTEAFLGTSGPLATGV